MNILYTAFNGKCNSSKVLLDLLCVENKLYLKNSFKTSVEQLENNLQKNTYDLIVSFGMSPLSYNSISIETIAKGEESYKTNFKFNYLKKCLELNNYNVVISKDAGGYLCNNIYYNGLKYIHSNNLKTDMIFIHIPKVDKITDIKKLSKTFEKYFKFN